MPTLEAPGATLQWCLLRAGIFAGERVVNVMEEAALPGAADFCLFHPGLHTAYAGMLE